MENEPATEIVYDAFISFSTDPDYNLSRKIEEFLERFHKLKTPKDIKLKPLSVCRDGSDFSLHSLKKKAAENAQGDNMVNDVLTEYLQKSQYLLVLCSKNSALSNYVQFEIDWFIKNKGVDAVLLAVTEGNNIHEEATTVFSETIIQHNIHSKIFYDLRGFRKESKQWKKVREHEEELTNIAAFLNNETTGNILPLWKRQERKRLKRQRYIGAIAAAVFLVLAIIAFIQRDKAIQNEKLAIANLKSFKKEQFQRNLRNGLTYYTAKEYSFAYNEFLAADSIISQYPDDSLLRTQKDYISNLVNECKTKKK